MAPALRRRLAFLDLALPAQRDCSGVAHTKRSEMPPQGQGKGLLPIWTAYQRRFGIRRISLALATRSGPEVAAMPSALPVEWQSAARFFGDKARPWSGHRPYLAHISGTHTLPKLNLQVHHQKLVSGPTVIHQWTLGG